MMHLLKNIWELYNFTPLERHREVLYFCSDLAGFMSKQSGSHFEDDMCALLTVQQIDHHGGISIKILNQLKAVLDLLL